VKIEQVLVYYLLKTKHLTLQGIGTFQLEGNVPDVVDSDKPVVLPENSVTFYYDPKVTEDEGLVDFIVEQTHKIKPLAASDLDSFLSLGRQFLNIGKPFTLPNIGTLEKLNSGLLAFKPGQMIAEKIEPNKIRNEEEDGTEPRESMFNEYQNSRRSKNGATLIFVLLILIVLGIIGWAVWHFGFGKNNAPETITTTEPVVPIKDSSFKTDSAIIAHSKPVNDTSFRIVVNQYRTIYSAEKRLASLKKSNRNVIMYTDNDSATFKIAEPFMLPLSDTTKVLDSLKKFYAKTYGVEIK